MEKRGRQIFVNCTCQQVNKAKNTGDKQRQPWSKPLLTAFARSNKENFLIHGELTETKKALFFFSELGGKLNFRSAFSFKLFTLKLTKLDTKRLKLSFATFEDTVKYLTFAHPLFMASCSRMNSPVNQTNHFLMVSFLILLRLLRVNILKQYYSSLSLSQYCWINSTSSWGLFNNINFPFAEQLLNIQNKIVFIKLHIDTEQKKCKSITYMYLNILILLILLVKRL